MIRSPGGKQTFNLGAFQGTLNHNRMAKDEEGTQSGKESLEERIYAGQLGVTQDCGLYKQKCLFLF